MDRRGEEKNKEDDSRERKERKERETEGETERKKRKIAPRRKKSYHTEFYSVLSSSLGPAVMVLQNSRPYPHP